MTFKYVWSLSLKPRGPLWPSVPFHSSVGEVCGHLSANSAPASLRALASQAPQPQGEAPTPPEDSPWLESPGAKPTECLLLKKLRSRGCHRVFLALLPKDQKSSFRTCHSSSVNS